MKGTLYRILFREFMILVATFFVSTLTCLFIMETWEISKINTIGWLSILLSTVTVPFVVLIIRLSLMSNSQINDLLSRIPSVLIRKKAQIFGKENVESIVDTLSTMMGEEGTSSILWEFQRLDLKEIENGCLKCNPNGLPKHNCQQISATVKKKRRYRVTEIANCLILDGGEYHATETKRPSSFVEENIAYLETQREILKKRGIKEPKRLLILEKKILIDEFSKNHDFLKKYIEYNINEGTDKEQNIYLKIIAYDKVDIDMVFDGSDIDRKFYDFVVSKKGKKVTVFAQNEECYLALYDSTDKTEKFHRVFERLYEHTKLTGKSVNICYSGKIEKFEDVESFIKLI